MKRMSAPLQYLDAIFGSEGIEQMSHIAIPVSKLREIWDALRSEQEECLFEVEPLDQEANEAKEAFLATLEAPEPKAVPNEPKVFADYLRQLPSDEARKEAIVQATGDFCGACGREVTTFCQCENDE